MCLPCKSDKMRVRNFMENRMTGYPIKFDQNEIEELKKKFRKISGNRQIIDKLSFQQNMGILGFSSVQGFSDRLFNSFDTDTDGKISFQDFVEYMEVLKSGNQKNKAKISFRLIDIKNKNSVNVKEFKEFLDDYFRSWTSITNSIVTPEMKERTDDYVERIFAKVRRQTNKNYVDFGYYAQKMFSDKQYIQSFEFITEGVANMFISGSKVGEDSTALYKVLKTIRQINAALTNSMDRFSGVSSDVDRLTGTSILGRSQKLKVHPTILKQQAPQNLAGNSRGFSKLNITPPLFGNTHDKNKTQTTMANNTHTFLNQNSTVISSHNESQCKNCLRVQVLEKKIQFLTSKIKKLVQETQRIYEKLDQKLFEKTMVKKNQTVDNIHVQRPVEGTMIFIGDDNWNLVLNMMIGIQMAVRSVRGYQQMIYEEPQDFDLKYYFELVPRRFGDQNYLSRICSFTDYAPNTFNHIRRVFNIDNEEYINSIGPNKLMTSLMMGEVTSLTGLTSQGKSGSFFYYTADGKYMLKTIHYRQYKHLRKILKDYYFYIKQNPQTLITKFFGLHKLIEKDQQGQVIGKSYFVIMANVFNTQQKIIERYDIKGSSYGRQTKSSHPNATKKDNDFKLNHKPLEIDPSYRNELMRIIRKDAEFFRAHEIIDYSLLIGIIKKDLTHADHHDHRQHARVSPQKYKSRQTLEYEVNCLKESHMYENVVNNEQYIFGIIDILTEYNTRKAMQYYFKSILYGKGVSAVPPDDYSERFVNFIDDVILKKTSDVSPVVRTQLSQGMKPDRLERMGQRKNQAEIEKQKEQRNKIVSSKGSIANSYYFRSKQSYQ